MIKQEVENSPNCCEEGAAILCFQVLRYLARRILLLQVSEYPDVSMNLDNVYCVSCV